jgi:hypothetical protein
MRTAHQPRPATADVGAVRRPAARARAILNSAVDWLRASYPDEAPTTGYSPLIALSGPASLTEKQRKRAVIELGDATISPTDIEVAITKATNRLPTPGQVRAVTQALHPTPRH